MDINNEHQPQIKGKLNFADGDDFYIFGNIDETIPEAIIMPLRKKLVERRCQHIKLPINIHISSYGGRVDYCFEIIGLIEEFKKLGVEVKTYTHSVACSAGSLIAVTGSKRYANKRAFHLLHFARGTGYYFHNPEMIDRNANHMKFIQKELVDIYKQYTKLKDIPAKLLADNYMINGGEALKKAGLIDEIL